MSTEYDPTKRMLDAWIQSGKARHGGAAALMAYLIARYDPTVGYASPMIADAMLDLGKSRSAVCRAIAEVKASGLWRVESGTGRKVSRYYLDGLLALIAEDGAAW